jgi:hypothetical protein
MMVRGGLIRIEPDFFGDVPVEIPHSHHTHFLQYSLFNGGDSVWNAGITKMLLLDYCHLLRYPLPTK